MKAKRKELASATYDGEEYKPGDCVLINPDASAPAYIARIRKLVQQSSDPTDVELEVTWFYRPEEAVGGRKAFHGESEVFDSDHQDKAPLAAILGRCFVHDVRRYEALQRRTENDFFMRFRYRPRSKQFEPDRVPVYCTCELPYNPDSPMVMCDECNEWYHPRCLKLSEDVLNQESFMCPSCSAPPMAKKQRSAAETAVAV
ncbi:Histone lysine demethylase PHF8 [Tetrabaena socialis]|uniref:Histone lysine demethylase PHF8 n=1 Tax=Tetrabaena socialis TaxID=47790 RepID=A0A2J8A831_9CHLO|nr:Histone lysine demethylase PHF8 [Tetrabaena socialis]|eukprot:PNH08668.1 Histone lysine demethylase PHF8 [Tetrabaena socialis]